MIIVRLVRRTGRNLIFVVVGVEMDRNGKLPNGIFAGGAFRAFFPANDRGEKQSGQDADDGNDNEHFHQREGGLR